MYVYEVDSHSPLGTVHLRLATQKRAIFIALHNTACAIAHLFLCSVRQSLNNNAGWFKTIFCVRASTCSDVNPNTFTSNNKRVNCCKPNLLQNKKQLSLECDCVCLFCVCMCRELRAQNRIQFNGFICGDACANRRDTSLPFQTLEHTCTYLFKY